MGSPELDALWILSKHTTVDEKVFNDLKKGGEDSGFNASKLKKSDQSKCSEDEKKKA